MELWNVFALGGATVVLVADTAGAGPVEGLKFVGFVCEGETVVGDTGGKVT
jgi:hypothetical protein